MHYESIDFNLKELTQKIKVDEGIMLDVFEGVDILDTPRVVVRFIRKDRTDTLVLYPDDYFMHRYENGEVVDEYFDYDMISGDITLFREKRLGTFA